MISDAIRNYLNLWKNERTQKEEQSYLIPNLVLLKRSSGLYFIVQLLFLIQGLHEGYGPLYIVPGYIAMIGCVIIYIYSTIFIKSTYSIKSWLMRLCCIGAGLFYAFFAVHQATYCSG